MLGLHHVQIAIPPGSEAAARAFYLDALGTAEIQKPPAITVRDMDALAARLVEHGADVVRDGEFPGFRRFVVHDPLGNRLEFLEPARP